MADENPGTETPKVDPEILAINLRMMKYFSVTLLPAIGLTILSIMGVSLLVFFFIASGKEDDIWGQVLAIHLVQIGAGLILGLLCLFLGAMMCWFGVSGTYTIGMEGGGAKLNIQGAQIGLMLLVGGMVLTGVSLRKSIAVNQGQIPAPGLGAGERPEATSTQTASLSNRSLVTAAPPPDAKPSTREAEASRTLAIIKAAESAILERAVGAAEVAAKNVEGAGQRGAAFQVVKAVKDFARQHAGEGGQSARQSSGGQ